MSTFGEIVRDRRSALSMTQTGLADLVGETTSVVRSWERGQSIPGDPDTLQTLATVLGVELEELLAPAKAAGYVEPLPEIEPGVRQLGFGSSLNKTTHDATEVIAVVEPEAEIEPTEAEVPAAVVDDEDVFEAAPAEDVPPQVAAAATRQAPARPASSTQVSAIRRIGRKRPSQASNYLDDPRELRSYRLRALYTAAGIIGLLIVGRFALAEVASSFSSIWSSFTENFRF